MVCIPTHLMYEGYITVHWGGGQGREKLPYLSSAVLPGTHV